MKPTAIARSLRATTLTRASPFGTPPIVARSRTLPLRASNSRIRPLPSTVVKMFGAGPCAAASSGVPNSESWIAAVPCTLHAATQSMNFGAAPARLTRRAILPKSRVPSALNAMCQTCDSVPPKRLVRARLSIAMMRTSFDQLLPAIIVLSGEITMSNTLPPSTSRSSCVAPVAASMRAMRPSIHATAIVLASGDTATARVPPTCGAVHHRSVTAGLSMLKSTRRSRPSRNPISATRPSALNDASRASPIPAISASVSPETMSIIPHPPLESIRQATRSVGAAQRMIPLTSKRRRLDGSRAMVMNSPTVVVQRIVRPLGVAAIDGIEMCSGSLLTARISMHSVGRACEVSMTYRNPPVMPPSTSCVAGISATESTSAVAFAKSSKFARRAWMWRDSHAR